MASSFLSLSFGCQCFGLLVEVARLQGRIRGASLKGENEILN
jgi:hypothetical protein